MTTHTTYSAAAAALLATMIGAGLTACGEDTDIGPAAVSTQELKPLEHQAYRDLANAVPTSVKPGEHLGRTDASRSASSVKAGEHLARAR